jgi:VWFA-related protein
MPRFGSRPRPQIVAGVLVLAAWQFQRADAQAVFKVESDLVLVNVIARDSRGQLIRDLKRTDFTLFEDGKPQDIASFDIERVDNPSPQAPAPATAPVCVKAFSAAKPDTTVLKNKRLLVLFFDFASMEPVDAQHAIDTARHFVEREMSPADVASVVSYSNSFRVVQDFTSDRDGLVAALKRLSSANGQGDDTATQAGAAPGSDTILDTSADPSVENTDLNLFNTDMELRAITTLSKALSNMPQRKSVLYFTGGLVRTGIENQAELNRAIDMAVHSNVALYAVDVRGLRSLIPGGDASKASQRGVAAFSGAAVKQGLERKLASQETLFTLSRDTGGKAFLDTNDFDKPFATVREDTSSYYLLGYRSSNPAMDGAYRHISVRVKRPGIKLDYRNGYYAQSDWEHLRQSDRKAQMEAELMSDLPETDLPVRVGTAHFRLSEGRYFVAATVVVPGSAIPFPKAQEKERAAIDILGMVSGTKPGVHPQVVRQTVHMTSDVAGGTERVTIQYLAGFKLDPGVYRCKFVVRENLTGKIGSFVYDLTVPDLTRESPKLSSVVLSQQVEPNPKPPNPMTVSPNVANVFLAGKPLYVYYEVYDRADKPFKLLTNVQLFRDNKKVFEAPLTTTQSLNTPGRGAAVFQIEVPGTRIRPGAYVCQVNVVDDTKNSYRYSRTALVVAAAH